MRKKKILRLDKHTIRTLTTDRLGGAAGGRIGCGCTHTQYTEPPFNTEHCTGVTHSMGDCPY